MGLFKKSKKRVPDMPPPLDTPMPPNISEETPGSLKSLGEPDIPPIAPSGADQIPDDEVPLPPPGLEEDVPPLPPLEVETSTTLFPTMPEETQKPKKFPFEHYDAEDFPDEKEIDDTLGHGHRPGEVVTKLPFEHYEKETFPTEKELKGTLRPKKIPDYDQLLESPMIRPIKGASHKSYFLNLNQYKLIMDSLIFAQNLTEDVIDTVERIEKIQEEKSARYDRFQHNLEGAYNLFGKLDVLVYTKEEFK